MLEHEQSTGLPGAYRITLALSVAFLFHTLLMASFPFDLPEHNNNPVTVRVQLVPEAGTPATQSAPAQTSAPVRVTPFTVDDILATQPTRDVPRTSRPQTRTVPEPSGSEAPETTVDSKTQPLRETQPQQSEGSLQSAPSVAGQKSVRQEESEQEVTLKSEAPSEESAYLSLLVQTIARKAQIPKLDQYEKGQVLGVQLELNLMANGALIDARITKSSGNEGLDRRVYRAALSASPYPEPPTSEGGRRRFRVEVRYTF
ncbi:cell envelope integrity protein TolA [Marinobacter halotolerans]|uniref:cell envelope integrity protein TolA n=1 Tax=Marinobacter halotolerans TaxID=1569211 RepID=UPI00124432D2|nr:TonB family protein [Marinobacter halotolerans]